VTQENASRRPVVVAYRAEWPGQAAKLIALLSDRLRPLAARIEHIGSTPIPGMAAKDVIDLQASTPDLDAVAAGFKQALAAMSEGIDDYTETKDWVVDVVIAAAEPWAAATGWMP
jgi:GrpB-like predicted nucleotidyltransferase (UPF0157 family)